MAQKYFCRSCMYGTKYKADYNRHLITVKHKKNIGPQNIGEIFTEIHKLQNYKVDPNCCNGNGNELFGSGMTMPINNQTVIMIGAEQYDHTIRMLNSEIIYLKKMECNYKSQIEFLKSVVASNNKIIGNAVYVLKNATATYKE